LDEKLDENSHIQLMDEKTSTWTTNEKKILNG
jgi:hypothetical protein